MNNSNIYKLNQSSFRSKLFGTKILTKKGNNKNIINFKTDNKKRSNSHKIIYRKIKLEPLKEKKKKNKIEIMKKKYFNYIKNTKRRNSIEGSSTNLTNKEIINELKILNNKKKKGSVIEINCGKNNNNK